MLQIALPQSGAGVDFAPCEAEQKACKHCGQKLPLLAFYRSRTRYSARCKDCHGLAPRTCRVCGISFEGSSNQILCSPECRKAYRPQTFKFCAHCGKLFGPVSHLRTRYCSNACKHGAQKKADRKPKAEATHLARAAQSAVARAIKSGVLHRPETCSECGRTGRIEAAHQDYNAPLDIRWLCRSCHSKWDWAQPKGGTTATGRGQSSTRSPMSTQSSCRFKSR